MTKYGNWVFPTCFHWICWIEWQKVLYFEKTVRTCHLLCMRPGCHRRASKTQVRDGIFKLSPIHASVMYQIPWIHWNHLISDPFRENSDEDELFMSLICKRISQWERCLSLSRLHVSHQSHFSPHYYRPQRGSGKVMFSQASVSHSVHRGQGGVWQTPPRADIPPPLPSRHIPGQTHPRADTPSHIRQPLQRTVRILRQCILVLL